MAVERKYERDIDIFLAEEFCVSPEFSNWFLNQTKKFPQVVAKLLDVYVSKTDSNGESDLVAVFEQTDGAKFALLIEDKIDAPLQPNQEARYRIRAEEGRRLGEYSDYEVILCAPISYRFSHPETSSFDSVVSYESIGDFLRSSTTDARKLYRANFITTAAKRSANIWTRIDDANTNSFWRTAYEIAASEFKELEMKPLTVTKDSTWINFRPQDMPTSPQRIYISFKGDRGFMDLTFTKSVASRFLPRIKSILEKDMTVLQTGKSAAIRIKVDGFKICAPDEASMSKMRTAFSACVRLIKFYRENRELLDNAASESLQEAELTMNK